MAWPADGPLGWPDHLDPAALRQPDGVSCGPTAVVVARLLVRDGTPPPDLGAEVRRTHRELTAPRDAAGRAQVPWPRPLGTPPWTVARALTALTGQRVGTHVARCRAGSSYDVLVARVQTRPVAVYLGDRWLPRHVVLAHAGDAAAVRVFDPARGALLTVPADRWRTHRVGIGRWSWLWAVV